MHRSLLTGLPAFCSTSLPRLQLQQSNPTDLLSQRRPCRSPGALQSLPFHSEYKTEGPRPVCMRPTTAPFHTRYPMTAPLPPQLVTSPPLFSNTPAAFRTRASALAHPPPGPLSRQPGGLFAHVPRILPKCHLLGEGFPGHLITMKLSPLHLPRLIHPLPCFRSP